MSRTPPEIAARVLAEEPVCRLCKRRPSTEVHHVSNRGVGYRDHSRPNLCGLCSECHRGIHTKGRFSYPASIGEPPLERGE